MASFLGRSKTGGRVVGIPNRRTRRGSSEELFNRLEAIGAEMGCSPGELDPIEGLARIAAGKNTPLEVKIDCLKSIAPYLYPKLATVSVRGDDDGPPIRAQIIDIGRFITDPVLAAAAQRVALAVEEDSELPDPGEPRLLEEAPRIVPSDEDS